MNNEHTGDQPTAGTGVGATGEPTLIQHRETLAEELARTPHGEQPDETTQVIDTERDLGHNSLAADQQFEPGDEPTRVMAPVPVESERDRVAREESDRIAAAARRQQEQAERQRALGTVSASEDLADDDLEPFHFNKRSTDKFFGAFGLLVLRLVTAVSLAVHGYQKVTNIDATTGFFTQLGLPYPTYFAWGVGIAELLAAVALVFGFMVRVVGLGVLAIGVGALVLVKWGSTNPFQAGQPGFVGELELLLAGIGLVLFCLGGGGWGIDGGLRRSRARRKAGL